MDGDGDDPLIAWPDYAAALAEESHPGGGWSAFMDQLEARMAQGKRDYGDKSFRLRAGLCCDEWAEEALDIAGWGFTEWFKVRSDPTLARDVLRCAASGYALWRQIHDVKQRLMVWRSAK